MDAERTGRSGRAKNKRFRGEGENDANDDELIEKLKCLWKNDAKPDELTLRLMSLLNSKLDDEQLKRMHESRKGCTLAEVDEYERLLGLAEGIGVGPAYVREEYGRLD